MLTCHYSEILRITRVLAGLDWPLGTDEEPLARVSIDRHLHKIKSLAQWPELFPVEERQYRADYASGTAYTAGTVVFFPQTQLYYQALKSTTGNAPADSGNVLNAAYWALAAGSFSGPDYASGTAYVAGDIVYYATTALYYQCHTAGTGNVPTLTAFWGVLVPFETAISFTQAGETAIGLVKGVYDANPRLTTRATPVRWSLTDNGITVVHGPVKVWVSFEVRLARLTGEVWSSTATYAVGEQVQFSVTTNSVEVINFYTCATATSAGESPTTAAAKWTLVELPDLFRDYLGANAAMDILVSDTDPRFAKAEQEAEEALIILTDNLYRNQQQIPRTKVLTYSPT